MKNVIVHYGKKTKEEVKNFLVLKDLQSNNLDWCKWAGWIDTDGTLGKRKDSYFFIMLGLRDRQPVELLSQFFETTLTYREHKTTTPPPYSKEYIAKEYETRLTGLKAFFLIQKIYPYLLNEEKKQRAIDILGYTPESKKLDDWTKEEFVSYFATAFEGDGYVKIGKRKTKKDSIHLELSSSNAEYLSLIKYLIEKYFNTLLPLRQTATYETKKGTRNKFRLHISNVEELYTLLVEDNIMTLDRKKDKILYYLNQGDKNVKKGT